MLELKKMYCIQNKNDDSFLFDVGDISFCSDIELSEKFLYYDVAFLIAKFLNLTCKVDYFEVQAF
jgi:hypothetical protein